MENENTAKGIVLETQANEILYREQIQIWDALLDEYRKKIGAKFHKLDINITVFFGIPVPQSFRIEMEFGNGRKYGQSDVSFMDCFNKLTEFINHESNDNIVAERTFKSIINKIWKKYPQERPIGYGKYWVYRLGCDKTRQETWNGTGWAYNNNDITHWAKLDMLKPIIETETNS